MTALTDEDALRAIARSVDMRVDDEGLARYLGISKTKSRALLVRFYRDGLVYKNCERVLRAGRVVARQVTYCLGWNGRCD